jgi:hypothetical protein
MVKNLIENINNSMDQSDDEDFDWFKLITSICYFVLAFKIIKMFERAGFAMNYFSNMFKSQYRGLMRYSGQYNLLIFTFGLIYFDHYLESRIRRDL